MHQNIRTHKNHSPLVVKIIDEAKSCLQHWFKKRTSTKKNQISVDKKYAKTGKLKI